MDQLMQKLQQVHEKDIQRLIFVTDAALGKSVCGCTTLKSKSPQQKWPNFFILKLKAIDSNMTIDS